MSARRQVGHYTSRPVRRAVGYPGNEQMAFARTSRCPRPFTPQACQKAGSMAPSAPGVVGFGSRTAAIWAKSASNSLLNTSAYCRKSPLPLSNFSSHSCNAFSAEPLAPKAPTPSTLRWSWPSSWHSDIGDSEASISSSGHFGLSPSKSPRPESKAFNFACCRCTSSVSPPLVFGSAGRPSSGAGFVLSPCLGTNAIFAFGSLAGFGTKTLFDIGERPGSRGGFGVKVALAAGAPLGSGTACGMEAFLAAGLAFVIVRKGLLSELTPAEWASAPLPEETAE
mmetsp:Transcript_66351/g.184851  ORF Transcript_66351/g.184851 Transcript_66351/m.184851 type:complete len:281 (+) Transcript_66351:61-903(+)